MTEISITSVPRDFKSDSRFKREMCIRDRYFDTHPITGVRFEGFEIPFFNEAVDLCKRAAMVVPQVQYVGWDVAITPSGPVIIEGNSFTGYDMPQNHKFHEDRCGLLKQFKEAFGEV